MTALRVEISIAWLARDKLNSKMREERDLSCLCDKAVDLQNLTEHLDFFKVKKGQVCLSSGK